MNTARTTAKILKTTRRDGKFLVLLSTHAGYFTAPEEMRERILSAQERKEDVTLDYDSSLTIISIS